MKFYIVALLWVVLLGCERKCDHKPAEQPAGLPSVGRSVASVHNETGVPVSVYVSFGADSVVLPVDWSFCGSPSRLNCQFYVAANDVKELPLGGHYLNATLSFGEPVSCGSTKAELNLNNPRWYDTTDVSLVDGYSNKVAIEVIEAGLSKLLGPPLGALGNEKVYGLFPYGCDVCTARQDPPCGIDPGLDGCKTGSQYHPDVPCQHQGTIMGGGSTVIVRLVE